MSDKAFLERVRTLVTAGSKNLSFTVCPATALDGILHSCKAGNDERKSRCFHLVNVY